MAGSHETPRWSTMVEVRFVYDSPLEEDGFEPSVPPQKAVKDAAGSLLDHLMDMNNAPEPRMPRVENLEFLDLMGVISSLCTTQYIRTRRWVTARRASSGTSWWKRRPRTRSALCVDRMKARCPRRRSGQGRQPRTARWRASLDASAAVDQP